MKSSSGAYCSDLADLYGVTTKRLNEQVKRNHERFPADFMFRLNQEEVQELNRSQIATGYLVRRGGLGPISANLKAPAPGEGSKTAPKRSRKRCGEQTARTFSRENVLMLALMGQIGSPFQEYFSFIPYVEIRVLLKLKNALPNPIREFGGEHSRVGCV